MNKPELLPCAHCGGQPRIVSPDIGDNTCKIYCGSCGSSLEYPTEEEAIAAWNRRDGAARIIETAGYLRNIIEQQEEMIECWKDQIYGMNRYAKDMHRQLKPAYGLLDKLEEKK